MHFEVCFFLPSGARKTRVVWAGYINQMNESISNSWLSTAFCVLLERCDMVSRRPLESLPTSCSIATKIPCCFGCMWRGNGLWAIAFNECFREPANWSFGRGKWCRWMIFANLVDIFFQQWEMKDLQELSADRWLCSHLRTLWQNIATLNGSYACVEGTNMRNGMWLNKFQSILLQLDGDLRQNAP